MPGNIVYAPFLRDVSQAIHSWPVDAWKAILVTPDYAPDKAHEFISDVSAFEVSGTGYTGGFGGSGRKTFASKSLDVESNLVKFRAANMTWTSINVGEVGGVVIAREVTLDNNSPLLAFLEFIRTTTGSNLPAVWHTDGLVVHGNLGDLV